MPTIRLEMPLFGTSVFYPAAPLELPEALLDEPTVLGHIAGLVEEPDAVVATDLEAYADQLELAESEFDDATPDDWVPPEPIEPPFEAPPPPYWGTTTDPARNAELTDAPGYSVEPEQPPLPPLEEEAPAPPPEEKTGILSWLDRRLRLRREQQPEQVVEPELVAIPAPDESPVVDDAPRESPAERHFVAPEPPQQPTALPEPAESPVVVERQAEPQLFAPDPHPLTPPEPVDIPSVIESPGESQTEPQLLEPEPVAPPAPVELPERVEPRRESQAEPELLAPEPPPQPVVLPAPVEIPVLVEPPRDRQAEPELLAPELPPQPVVLPAPVETPVPVEPPRERQTEPQLLAPEPPPQAVAPPPPVEIPVVVEPPRETQTEPQVSAPEPLSQPVVVDVPRSRRSESRLPKRGHLPSLFAPSAEPSPPPVADKAPRAGRFGLRMWRRPVPATTAPLFPVEPPFADEATETRAVEPPEPAPAVDSPPLPVVVEDVPHKPQDLPVEAASEPRPAHDLPPPAEEIVPAPEPPAPPTAHEEPAPTGRSAAYWAEPNWAKSDQTMPDQPESLAWTPPPNPLTAAPGSRRTTPAMEGLWETEAVGVSDTDSLPQGRPGGRVVRRVAALGGGVVVLAAASIAVFHFLPRAFVSNLVPAATFNAPMMVLRANGPGRVVSVAVQNGQAVDPATLLLTIRTEPQPDPAAALLRARLEAAQAHLSELDQSLAQATPSTDAGRARIADLRRQRASAVIDVAQLQDGVTNIPPPQSNDLPVKAGVHGVIRSLEARNGTTTVAGVPLVRMLDCDHAFLTVPPDSRLRAGEAVQVRLPNLPPVAATVRQSSGIAEPPDSLVIATKPGAFVGQLSGSCPIGATATITPSMTGS